MFTVLITGASRGIGRAAALLFSKQFPGANLVLVSSQSPEALGKTASDCESLGAGVLFRSGDVSDPDFCRSLVEEAEQCFDHVDLLINNAGIAHIGLLQDMSPEEWDRILDVNLKSAFLLSRLVIPGMVRRQSGTILNISSMWGSVGGSCEVAYSASKGGMNTFTRALAKELAPSGISVNALACGVIDTEMNHCFSEEERSALVDEIPIGRMGTPEEIAEILVWLAGAPKYLTGQVIGVDGGYL